MTHRNSMQPPTTVGSFETVDLPEFGIFGMIAKVDTGAYSGALHCDTIKEITEDGVKKLCFVASEDHAPHTVDRYIKTWVRSSTGHRVRRYLVDTKVVVQGATYPIRVGLADRSEMKYDMLIGRRFLREQAMLVDVRINQEYDTDGMKQE